jgi:predicted outer membrane protein
MTRRLGTGALLLVALVLLAACGTAATPTPAASQATEVASPTSPPATTAAPSESTSGDDWRSMGAADAPVVIEDYSDFQ